MSKIVQVKILVRARPTGSTYVRYHGLSIDGDLDYRFWETQPNKIIKVTRSEFYEVQYIDLPDGEHYLIYGNSEDSRLTDVHWSINVAVNDSLLAEEVLVDRRSPLKVTFYVGEPPPPPPPPRKFNWWWLLLIVASIIGTIGVQSTRKKEQR